LITINEQEYELFLQWKYTNNNPKLCDGYNCEYYKESNKKKWSTVHFLIGIIKDIKALIFKPQVWVFVITTAVFIIFANKDLVGIWIAYISLGGAFMFYEPLSSLISRGNLNVNAGVGIQKNINK